MTDMLPFTILKPKRKRKEKLDDFTLQIGRNNSVDSKLFSFFFFFFFNLELKKKRNIIQTCVCMCSPLGEFK
jgi:hypothetical protein